MVALNNNDIQHADFGGEMANDTSKHAFMFSGPCFEFERQVWLRQAHGAAHSSGMFCVCSGTHMRGERAVAGLEAHTYSRVGA